MSLPRVKHLTPPSSGRPKGRCRALCVRRSCRTLAPWDTGVWMLVNRGSRPAIGSAASVLVTRGCPFKCTVAAKRRHTHPIAQWPCNGATPLAQASISWRSSARSRWLGALRPIEKPWRFRMFVLSWRSRLARVPWAALSPLGALAVQYGPVYANLETGSSERPRWRFDGVLSFRPQFIVRRVNTGLSLCSGKLADRSTLPRGAHVRPNPSIERTFQRPLRCLWPAAHVER